MARGRKPKKSPSKASGPALARRDFLRAAGAGVAGVPLLGAAGCGGFAGKLPRVPEEYLPSGRPESEGLDAIVRGMQLSLPDGHALIGQTDVLYEGLYAYLRRVAL